MQMAIVRPGIKSLEDGDRWLDHSRAHMIQVMTVPCYDLPVTGTAHDHRDGARVQPAGIRRNSRNTPGEVRRVPIPLYKVSGMYCFL